MNSQQARGATPSTPGRWALLTPLLLLAILLLAFGLRFYRLDAQSLWNDEGTSVAVAQCDLATITRDAAHDIHPPLYYWLLSGWLRLLGHSEAAVRSLSVLLGVVLVALTYLLGRWLGSRWLGLVAALLAAVNPFQVYYSQEARMYVLLAVLAAGTMLALARLVERPSLLGFAFLVLLEVAGLYTHYSFAFVILAANLSYALWLALIWRREPVGRRAWHWLLSQAAVVLLYLPWLPIALRQISTWPKPAEGLAAAVPWSAMLAEAWRWLVLGPTIETGQAVVPLLVAALAAALGALSLARGWVGRPTLRARWGAGLLVIWAGLPLLLMLALGLYREAYLKFLLVATPPLLGLLACGLLSPLPARPGSETSASWGALWGRRVLRLAQAAAALSILFASLVALRNYYTDPAYARDDYRSIAAYIEAVGQPGDAVLLNAPGQQEVFNYYYRGDLPLVPLPTERPLDPAATESALAALGQPGGRVFALLWATDESDPERFIEGWLDSHAYKALDSWYGNVRLAVYALPERAPSAPDRTLDVLLRNSETGDVVQLHGYSLLNDRLAAGDIAQITLFWEVERMPTTRYKVFLHALDRDSQIVGQRDAEPGGGALLTTLWPPGEPIVDNYGLPVHPATAPGTYRVEVGLYDPQTGQRLTTPDGESQVWLEPLQVERPATPAPLAALGIQHPADARFAELTLLGYDLHRLGFAPQPDVGLRPGDTAHIALYWRAEAQPGGDWRLALDLLDEVGQERAGINAEPVGGYATSLWQPGGVWRGQFNLVIPVDAPAGCYRLRVQLVGPDGTPGDEFLLEPFEVEP